MIQTTKKTQGDCKCVQFRGEKAALRLPLGHLVTWLQIYWAQAVTGSQFGVELYPVITHSQMTLREERRGNMK